jgi:GWxTD domain-containing protein
MRRPCCALVAAALLLSAGVSAAGERTSEAERLAKDAAERWEKATLEQRHKAIEALEQAAKLAPGDLRVRSQLGHAYLDAGYNHDAKETFEHITELAPSDADAWEALGRVWKRDWVAMLAPKSRDKAVTYVEQAVRVEPSRATAWTLLALLYLERGDSERAQTAAAHALAAAPDSAPSALIAAVAAYEGGRLARSDSLFALGIARLPPRTAFRFRDFTPLVSRDDGETLLAEAPPLREEAARRFWSVSDPDPTTQVNEAKVEYWTRVARATLLFSDSWEPRWDRRAELYVRYGPPEHIAYEPPGVVQERGRTSNVVRAIEGVRSDDVLASYPQHAQVWEYPRLGMSVLLEDPTISQHYEFPRNPYMQIDAAPDPGVMARNGLLPTAGGRGTFAPLPPGMRPLPVEGIVSVFEGEHGPRLLAHVAVPGSPATALIADCVVIDSSEREIQRASRTLGTSRCDPAATRAGDFSFDLPPGPYRVALAVSDGHGLHGVLRTRRAVAPVIRVLALSDIVLVCGPLDVLPAAGDVRLDPNLERQIVGDEPLLAYFEVYRLRPEANGATRFEYQYSVRSLDRDTRPFLQRLFSRPAGERISVHSPEEGVGPTRRQYLSVPASSLPPGHYRLEVTVKDHATGASAHREVEFVKAPAAADAAVGAR